MGSFEWADRNGLDRRKDADQAVLGATMKKEKKKTSSRKWPSVTQGVLSDHSPPTIHRCLACQRLAECDLRIDLKESLFLTILKIAPRFITHSAAS